MEVTIGASRTSTSSEEVICLGQNMPKYILSGGDCCGRRRRSSSILAFLRNKLCFSCQNERSVTSDMMDIEAGEARSSRQPLTADWLCCSRQEQLRVIHTQKNVIRPSSATTGMCVINQQCNTLPTSVHRSRERPHLRSPNPGIRKDQATSICLQTLPRIKTTAAVKDHGLCNPSHSSTTMPTRRSVRRQLTQLPISAAEAGNAADVDIRCSEAAMAASPTSASDKGDRSGKWLLSEESSRPSSEEITSFDDEVYESYETTCSEPQQQPCLTLPPVYDQVKEDPYPGWSLSKELSKLTKHGWYWGPITRVEAEDKLSGQPDGTFLVRDSSDDHYLLSLSFRSYGRTLHTRIEHCNGVFSLYTAQAESEGYASIVDLIEHSVRDSQTGVFCYSRARSIGSPSFPVRLTRPVSRFSRVRSLQYLCRFLIRQHTRVDHIQSLPLPVAIKGFLEERQY